MADSVHQLVKRRAHDRCEYCWLSQQFISRQHEMDHVIALKHRGPTVAGNLAWACFECSRHKSCNIAGVDPTSGAIVRLFNPRRHKWSAHFQWDGAILLGRTEIGRATIEVLEINLPHRTAIRQALIDEGVFPP